MTPTEKAKLMISQRSTKQLVNDFILSGKINDPNMPTVRGWIMDELERRDFNSFIAWLDQDKPTDKSLAKFFPA